MIKPINNIVIVGGGSAGWMTAAALIKFFPEKNITIVESPNVPTVGVGESTLGHINKFCRALEIDEKDFMVHTDASYKMSIKFTDFYEKDSGSFHYPFGTPYVEGTWNKLDDWFIKKCLYPETPNDDFVDTYFPAMSLVRENKISYTDPELDNFTFEFDVAYHFDATKFGLWLRDRYCLPRGVTHLQKHISNVVVNDQGIKYLQFTDESTLTGDLYIDCTGFRSLLLGQALNEKFISYNDILPNNKAWTTRLKYKDKEKELEPFTNCTAIQNGWVWNIPSWSTIGTGYVFSDKYVSEEEAKEEFKQYLMSDKMVISRTQREVEENDYRLIDMRVGIHERTFVKNVVAIGLSAGFIEPLESNGLFTVHEFIFKLLHIMQRPAITQYDKDLYNGAVKGLWEGFCHFVIQHYALSLRNDTRYWKDVTGRTYHKEIVENKPSKINNHYSLMYNKMVDYKTFIPDDGLNCITVGFNYFPIDKIGVGHMSKFDFYNIPDRLLDSFATQERNKARWKEVAKNKPTILKFLTENIHV